MSACIDVVFISKHGNEVRSYVVHDGDALIIENGKIKFAASEKTESTADRAGDVDRKGSGRLEPDHADTPRKTTK